MSGSTTTPAAPTLANVNEGASIFSFSDVDRIFSDCDKLTSHRQWQAWSLRVRGALDLFWLNWHDAENAHTTAPSHAVQNMLRYAVVQRVGDYLLPTVTQAGPSVRHVYESLAARFDPQTTTTEANEMQKLFALRRPIWEFDKLLDDAELLYSRIMAKGVTFPDSIYYSALTSIVPPQYSFVRANYESECRTKTPVVDPKPHELIHLLRTEFFNYRAQPSTSSLHYQHSTPYSPDSFQGRSRGRGYRSSSRGFYRGGSFSRGHGQGRG
jgi:hypothetical protein